MRAEKGMGMGMIINELHIAAFGGLTDREIFLDRGLNILEGANESGKTSAAMFIKFIFYGLSPKSTGGGLSERKKYVNLQKSMAAGHLVCTVGDVKYRIERNLTLVGEGEGTARETVRIVNLSDGTVLNGEVPGEYFFGVNESMFVNTVFVGQLASIRPDGEGLGSAVENMLSSADESVNLKKAIERLNAARREIHHKNGNGGEIALLTEERAALEEEVQSSTVSSAELIEAEASLAEALRKKEQLAARKEKLDGVVNALDVLLVKKKLEAVSHTEEKIEALRERVEEIDGSGFPECGPVLDRAEREIRAYREGNLSDGDTDGAVVRAAGEIPTEDELDDAFYLDGKCRIQLSVGIAMLIAGVLGLAASAFLYYCDFGSYLVPLMMTGMCAFIGIIFFLVRHRTLNDLYDILDYWDVDTVEDMEDLAYGDENGLAKGEEEKPLYRTSSDAFGKACEAIEALASAAGITPSSDPLETAAAVRDYSEKLRSDRDNMKARMENYIGRLSVLKEQAANTDWEKAEEAAAQVAATPYGKLAMQLDAEGIKKVIRERDFTNGAYQSQLRRAEELERKLIELKGRAKSPAEAASRIEEIDERLRELELKRDGYNLAMEALKKAGENMRSNVVPQLTANASQMLSRVVDGKYGELILNADFGMNYTAGSETRSAEHMSKGTHDAAYIALRFALMQVVYKKAMPPVVLDESFAFVDEDRLMRLLACIAESECQSLFFTCREREAVEAAKEHIPFCLIRM